MNMDIIRVMDAARVIHERQSALDEHAAFDRAAAVAEIQAIYAEIGDVVDAAAIEQALDAHLAEQHAFQPAPRGIRRAAALLYVWRRKVALRFLAPAAAVALAAWGGMAAIELASEAAAERRAAAERAEAALLVESLDAARATHAVLVAAAAEEIIVTRADALLGQAEGGAALEDAGAVAQAASELEALRSVVDAEYAVVVTGGIERYPNDQPGVTNHYLLVRAVDPAGRTVEISILNEETGAISTVEDWGERVAPEVYERLRADRTDNGIIDDPDFGSKRRGYVTVERRYPDLGQITAW